MKPRAIATPEPGHFKMKLTRGGPFVSALIHRPCPIEFNPETFQSIDRYPHLVAEIDSKPADVLRVWTSGKPISQAEYLYLRDDRAWCRAYTPDAPEANPDQAIDLGNMAPLF